MANASVKDASGATVRTKTTGAGSDGDPFIPHHIVDSSGLPAGAATEAALQDILTALAALQTELNQKLEAGGEVALDAATLSALETVTAAISGTVTVDSELTTTDMDTGAGTDTKPFIGIALRKSGGAYLPIIGPQAKADSIPIAWATEHEAKIDLMVADLDTLAGAIASGAMQVRQEALRGGPIMAATAVGTSHTDTAKHEVPWLTGLSPDSGQSELGYLSSISVSNRNGVTGFRLDIYSGDPDSGGVYRGHVAVGPWGGNHTFPDGAVPIAINTAIYVKASDAITTGWSVSITGFENVAAPA